MKTPGSDYVWYRCSRANSPSENPRLSALLVLFNSGLVAFVASFFSTWLPGANGRFDEKVKPEALLPDLEHAQGPASPRHSRSSTLPKRPRRFFLPALVIFVVLRLEIFHRVVRDFQCATPGIEVCNSRYWTNKELLTFTFQSFLPFLLLLHDIYTRPKSRAARPSFDDDFSSTVFDELGDWIKSSSALVTVSCFLFNYTVYLSVQPPARSTFFCSPVSDSSTFILFLQWLGLALDAVSLILLWRILAWTRTTKSRLRTLGTILLLVSAVLAIQWSLSRLFGTGNTARQLAALKRVTSLYAFDVFVDSFVFAILFVSMALLICEEPPIVPVSAICLLCGIMAALRTCHIRGSYLQKPQLETLGPLYVLSLSFSVFLYSQQVRSVIFARRAILIILLFGILIYGMVVALVNDTIVNTHPLEDLIYNTRVESDRWLRQASVSSTLRVAVSEYQERNYERKPPPNFDKWYSFAKERGLVIMDHFEQIEKDIRPFWGMKPENLRVHVARAISLPRVGVITISDGAVTYNWAETPEDERVLQDAVRMIEKFSKHLPDMKIPVNLEMRPRIVATWEEIQGWTERSEKRHFNLLSRRSSLTDEDGSAETAKKSDTKDGRRANGTVLDTRQYRQMAAVACPPGSAARSGLHWNVRDLCTECISPQSSGELLTEWEISQDLCHQPDVTNLHSFYMNVPREPPIQELLPMFSRSKTDSFNDILIPLSPPPSQLDRTGEPVFYAKKDVVYWRGKLTDEDVSHSSLHGSHGYRLAHLINNSTSDDTVSMLLPLYTKDNKAAKTVKDYRFAYDEVPARQASAVLPFDVGWSGGESCTTPGCYAVARELGGSKAEGKALENRYIMLLDEDDGPPRDLLTVLRSNSVPLVSSIYKEWHSERLMPWIHFIPIDVRFHALHSTMAYFISLQGRGALNGKQFEYPGRLEDARWIAEQGKRWAEKALRQEDMEIYLFRLLLEWGRVIQDDRDEIGFSLEEVVANEEEVVEEEEVVKEAEEVEKVEEDE